MNPAAPTNTIDFYAVSTDAPMIAATLILRCVWFSVDPYPNGIYRFDVKPEAARHLQELGINRQAP